MKRIYILFSSLFYLYGSLQGVIPVEGAVPKITSSSGDVLSEPKLCQNVQSQFALQASITAKTNPTNLPWSLPGSWVGGIVPKVGDEVIIPNGAKILLNQNVDVKSISVMGSITVDATKDIDIRAEYIMVMGSSALFEWGTETNPYKLNGKITLVGNDPTAVVPGHIIESKAIMVMSQGKLELHGDQKTRWVQLSQTANAGENKLTLTSGVNWKSGDEIILTSTAIETKSTGRIPANSQTEKLTVKSIAGNVLTLNENLKFKHFGVLQTFNNGNGKSWVLDERAEVGNLTRNIKIEGSLINSTDEKTKRFGGHVMVMDAGSVAHLESVEFNNMGQGGNLGRYPFHWHLVGNATGQYIRDCAVKNANNRALTVHGTQNTVVSNNVVHNVLGHAIFLEDGNETGVTIDRNLVAEVLKPSEALSLLESDRFFQNNRIEGPSGIWLMNPNNDVTNNAVVGTGAGFWYSLDETAHGAAALLPIQPNRTPFGKFEGNRAHGCYVGFNTDFVDDKINPRTGGVLSTANYYPKGEVFSDFTGFSNYRALWFRGSSQNYDNFRMANNNGLGQWVPTFLGVLKNSLVVGHSANNNGTIDFETYATSIYDGNLTIENTHFENFDQSKQAIYTTFGGAHKYLPAVAGVGLTMKNCNVYRSPSLDNDVEFAPYISFVEDQQGALTGVAGNWIINDHPFMIDPSFTLIPDGQKAYHSANKFARLGVEFAGKDRSQGKQLVYMDWGNGSPAHNGPAGSFAEFPLMVNSSRIYSMRFTEFIDDVTTLWYDEGRNGDWVRFFIEGVPEKLAINGGNHVIQEVNNLTALINATSSTSFYDPTTNYMHFKLKYNESTRKIVLKTPTAAKMSVTLTPSLEHIYRPFRNNLHVLGENVQAEHFDYGGQGVGYYETIDWELSKGGGYVLNARHFASLDHISIRQGEIVDLSASGGGNYSIIDNEIGDWWKYSFDITKAGTYPISISAAAVSGTKISIQVDEVKVLDATLKGSGTPILQDLGDLTLSKGKHYVVIKLESLSLNKFDWFKIGDPIITQIEDLPSFQDQEASIYPNPSSDGIINLSRSANWKVYSLLGIELKTGLGTSIDIHEQPKGIYLIKLSNEIQRVIVE